MCGIVLIIIDKLIPVLCVMLGWALSRLDERGKVYACLYGVDFWVTQAQGAQGISKVAGEIVLTISNSSMKPEVMVDCKIRIYAGLFRKLEVPVDLYKGVESSYETQVLGCNLLPNYSGLMTVGFEAGITDIENSRKICLAYRDVRRKRKVVTLLGRSCIEKALKEAKERK